LLHCDINRKQNWPTYSAHSESHLLLFVLSTNLHPSSLELDLWTIINQQMKFYSTHQTSSLQCFVNHVLMYINVGGFPLVMVFSKKCTIIGCRFC